MNFVRTDNFCSIYIGILFEECIQNNTTNNQPIYPLHLKSEQITISELHTHNLEKTLISDDFDCTHQTRLHVMFVREDKRRRRGRRRRPLLLLSALHHVKLLKLIL